MKLSREQILGHRLRANGLNERLPMSSGSLERAAHAGLQDSMPRAALLSLHARVTGATPTTWEDAALVQVWGPRYSAYVIAARDRDLFTLGRLPGTERGRHRAEATADRLRTFLAGRRMSYEEAGRALGVDPNALRYATTTGTLLIRWEGARRPIVWTVPPPEMTAREARLELARRYLHIFGPATPTSFADWAGIAGADAKRAFEELKTELRDVESPIGEAWMLATDEPSFHGPLVLPAAARLLPSGDAHYLLWGADRELLVPDPSRRELLWTSRVWPGALLVGGEIVGTWRRNQQAIDIDAWRSLSRAERQAVEQEAHSLPLPGRANATGVRTTIVSP